MKYDISHQNFLADLDLEPIMVKAMDSDEGYSWSLEKSHKIAIEYRRFLTLCVLYPDEAIVPSAPVDDFWHMHILDTEKYANDCAKYLGFFLHHFPYFGMRSADDARNLARAWGRTLELYELAFGESPVAEYWPHSKRCPNCGRHAGNDMMSAVRPRLADILVR